MGPYGLPEPEGPGGSGRASAACGTSVRLIASWMSNSRWVRSMGDDGRLWATTMHGRHVRSENASRFRTLARGEKCARESARQRGRFFRAEMSGARFYCRVNLRQNTCEFIAHSVADDCLNSGFPDIHPSFTLLCSGSVWW